MISDDVLMALSPRERLARVTTARRLITGLSAVYVGAYAASFVEIETVMGSGPILSIVGIVAARANMRCACGPGVALGVLAGVLSVALVGAVNLYQWSPSRAEGPFAAIGMAVLLAGGPLVALAWRRLRIVMVPPAPSVVSTGTLLPVPERQR